MSDIDDQGFAESSVSDDLGSMEYSLRNTLDARFSQLRDLPSLLNIWLECLEEIGDDLEKCGRKETGLHEQGLLLLKFDRGLRLIVSMGVRRLLIPLFDTHCRVVLKQCCSNSNKYPGLGYPGY